MKGVRGFLPLSIGKGRFFLGGKQGLGSWLYHVSGMRNNARIVAVALFLIAVSACAAPQAQVPQASRTLAPGLAATLASPAAALSLIDDAGRQVVLKASPKRIVSLAPSNTEIIYAIGDGDLLVGDTDYCDYPPEAKDKTKVGGFSKIDLERVVGLEPDLVLATDIHVKAIVPELEKRGITVVVIAPQSVDKILDKIALLGRLTGATPAAEKLVALLQARLDKVAVKTAQARSKPRVFYEVSKDLYTAGPGSFIDDLITRAGGINIASDAHGTYPQLTLESLVQKDPEVILLGDHPVGGTPDQVRARPGWSNISAVKSGRIVPIVDANLVNRAGPRAVDGLEEIARDLYPELLSD